MSEIGKRISHWLTGLVAIIGGSVLQAGTVAITAPTNAPPSPLTPDPATDRPGQVIFQYPTNGMVFSAPFTGTVFLSDYGQTARLDCFVNGALKRTTSNPFLSLTLSNLAADNYTLTGIATDNQGAKATNAITIAVVNDIPPTITLVNPTNDSFFPTGTAVTLQVSAADKRRPDQASSGLSMFANSSARAKPELLFQLEAPNVEKAKESVSAFRIKIEWRM